jgi:hypothetical protein
VARKVGAAGIREAGRCDPEFIKLAVQFTTVGYEIGTKWI